MTNINKKIYFASDFHLGLDEKLSSIEREVIIVSWLDEIKASAEALYLVGDIFDYWFEYGEVIPKGFSRLLSKLREYRDADIPVFFFTGNHDMWMFQYFEKELGIPVYRAPITRTWNGKKFYIGHGDGLGPGDHGYKFIKSIFSNRVCQWLFARIHPNIGIKLMRYFSQSSRKSNSSPKTFLGDEKEWLVLFANDYLERNKIDYFIFGHRHLPIEHTLKNGDSLYINLGDWVQFFTYAVFDGNHLTLEYYKPTISENK